MRSGEHLMGATEYPKGDAENPLSESEVLEKFKSLTRGLITDDWADALCQRVMALESSPDVSTLLTR